MRIDFFIKLLFGLFLIVSCKKESPERIDPEANDAVWIKLSIPQQIRGMSAIYGSIDDTLVVATTYKIYLTTNQGRSWEMVHDGGQGVSGFSKYKGELIALSNFGEYASMPFLFSLDHGKTWSAKGLYDYTIYDQIRQAREMISINDQMQLKIQSQPDKITDESSGRPLRQPDQLLKVENGMETSIHFPFRRDLNYIYLDGKKRLYVGAEGTRFEWSKQNNTRIYPTQTDSALIYISRLAVDKF